MGALIWCFAGLVWLALLVWNMRTAPQMPRAMEEADARLDAPIVRQMPLSDRLASREAWRSERQSIEEVLAEALVERVSS